MVRNMSMLHSWKGTEMVNWSMLHSWKGTETVNWSMLHSWKGTETVNWSMLHSWKGTEMVNWSMLHSWKGTEMVNWSMLHSWKGTEMVNWRARKRFCSSTNFSSKNLMRARLESNPGVHSERPTSGMLQNTAYNVDSVVKWPTKKRRVSYSSLH
jgi:hypothetical protein